jgi:hypothetical protein
VASSGTSSSGFVSKTTSTHHHCRVTRPNVRCNCQSWCSNAIAHLGGIPVSHRHLLHNTSVIQDWATGWMIGGLNPGRGWEFFSSSLWTDGLWSSWARVAVSSKAVTAPAATVRTLGGLSSPCRREKNTTNSTLCRSSKQSVRAKVVYGQGPVWRVCRLAM